MNTQNVIVTHILPTGTAFGATTGKPAESVFIPGHIASPAGVVVGQEVEAMLVPNTREPERTPWLAVKLDLLAPASVQVDDVFSVEDCVLEALREGGEWTVEDMAVHLGAGRSAVADALETIYNKDLCAKYQLWRKRSDTELSDEWFTCYPDEVDFVTGVE
jgi:hypothetical protein